MKCKGSQPPYEGVATALYGGHDCITVPRWSKFCPGPHRFGPGGSEDVVPAYEWREILI